MSTDRDTRRIVRSWLKTNERESADRVLDAVLDRLDTTPQRRATWWPARRYPTMNNIFRISIAAAAVVAVALVGMNLFGGRSPGGPSVAATPSPSATPSPTPSARLMLQGAEGPGTFTTVPFDGETVSFTFEMPTGWRAGGEAVALPIEIGPEGPTGAGLVFLQVAGLYSDPCHGNEGDPDVPVGSSADDLVAALVAQSAYEVSTPSDIEMGGFRGVQIDLQLPSDLDFASCQEGQFWVWDAAPYAQGPANRWRLWILDVDGTTAVILAEDFPGTAPQLKADLQSMIQSMKVDA
jgi:hypothetical protein